MTHSWIRIASGLLVLTAMTFSCENADAGRGRRGNCCQSYGNYGYQSNYNNGYQSNGYYGSQSNGYFGNQSQNCCSQQFQGCNQGWSNSGFTTANQPVIYSSNQQFVAAPVTQDFSTAIACCGQ